jgi:hypothetical protein
MASLTAHGLDQRGAAGDRLIFEHHRLQLVPHMVGLLEGLIVGLAGPNGGQGRQGLSIPAGELRPQLLFQLPFAPVPSRVGGRVGHLAHDEDPSMAARARGSPPFRDVKTQRHG